MSLVWVDLDFSRDTFRRFACGQEQLLYVNTNQSRIAIKAIFASLDPRLILCLAIAATRSGVCTAHKLVAAARWTEMQIPIT
jgi:hypothetical protein